MVESLAISATVRPSTRPRPVITPSAGSSGSSALAKRPSSTKEPSSSSSRIRSRAKSLPVSAFLAWYLGAPPCSMRLRSRSTRSSKALFSGVTAGCAHGYLSAG